MRIFILEDDPNRMKLFNRTLHTHTIYHADNVKDAIKILESTDGISVLLVDHDLDHKVFVNSNESNTGYQLAKWIKTSGKNYMQIIIHSMNVVGANNIKNELSNCTEDLQVIPFHLLIPRLAITV